MKASSIIFFSLCLLFMNSCKEKIEFELNNEEFKRVVVEGLITNEEKSHLVKLSYTSSYYQDEIQESVTGAEVTITDGTEIWPLTESPAGSGYYYTADNVSGTIDVEHELMIIHEGETYLASDYMNPVAPLDSIYVEKREEEPEEEDEDDFHYMILTWTQETPGLGDYYRWRMYINDVTANDSLENYSWGDDSFYDGAVLEAYDFWRIRQDVEIGDTIKFEQMSISQQANDIFIAMSLETYWRGGLFDSAPANVQTNITNGGIGFFGASAVSSKTAIIEE